jgi:hypothetical protein
VVLDAGLRVVVGQGGAVLLGIVVLQEVMGERVLKGFLVITPCPNFPKICPYGVLVTLNTSPPATVCSSIGVSEVRR